MLDTITCPRCGQQSPIAAHYCRRCGTRMAALRRSVERVRFGSTARPTARGGKRGMPWPVSLGFAALVIYSVFHMNGVNSARHSRMLRNPPAPYGQNIVIPDSVDGPPSNAPAASAPDEDGSTRRHFRFDYGCP